MPRLFMVLASFIFCLLGTAHLSAQENARSISQADGYGLFIGIGKFEYRTGLKPLVYAPDDAVLLAHLFVVEWHWLKPQHTKLALGGSPKSKTGQHQLAELKRLGVKTVSPNHRGLQSALQKITGSSQRNAPLIISFSGHGYQGPGNTYFMPEDANWQLIKSTGVSSAFLTDCLKSSSSSKKLLLLDACSTWIDGQKGDAEQEHQLFQQQLQSVKNLTLLASCLPGELSWQSTKLEHGIFTRTVYDEMQNEADQLRTWSPDEWKRLSEKSGHEIEARLQAAKWNSQTPWFFTTAKETR